MVLHQEPSPSEAISPRVARPYIQALSSISLEPVLADDEEGEDEDERELEEEKEKQPHEEKKEGTEEMEAGVKEEAVQLEELTAVMDQVGWPH